MSGTERAALVFAFAKLLYEALEEEEAECMVAMLTQLADTLNTMLSCGPQQED